MSSTLDLDDVSATSPEAMRELAETRELVNDMTQALEDLVKVWKAIEAIAPKKRYAHLIEKHQALIDRARRHTEQGSE